MDRSLIICPEEPCPYLPRQTARMAVLCAGQELSADTYERCLELGFRRSGTVIYRPACQDCQACIALRVRVSEFRPGRSQRRCWRRNSDLQVEIAPPVPTDEKYALYERYLREWHGRAPEDGQRGFERFLYQSPVPTLEFTYRDSAGRLLAVGICDLLVRSLSSVYAYFDPLESRRGLGTYSALYEIEYSRRRGLQWYYLGYWIEACGAMGYKASFRPCELLGNDGAWKPAETQSQWERPC